ncbi:hypothetical protein [Pseudoramibacter alactolyticus]
MFDVTFNVARQDKKTAEPLKKGDMLKKGLISFNINWEQGGKHDGKRTSLAQTIFGIWNFTNTDSLFVCRALAAAQMGWCGLSIGGKGQPGCGGEMRRHFVFMPGRF